MLSVKVGDPRAVALVTAAWGLDRVRDAVPIEPSPQRDQNTIAELQ